MKNLQPFGYTKAYIFKKHLSKLIPYNLKYHHGRTAFSDLSSKTIYLPFVEPLDLKDLKILLEHEAKHFEITKEPIKVTKSHDLNKVKLAANVLEDIIVNETLSRKDLETVFKKLNAPSLQLTLWQHYNSEEKIKVVKKAKQNKVLKDSISDEEIIKTIDETVKTRKKYNSAKDFEWMKPALFKKYCDLFEKPPVDSPGDGPAEMDYKGRPPDYNLVKQFERLLKAWRVKTEDSFRTEEFIGKRLNRKFIENLTHWKPFIKQYEIRTIKKPKVLILLDCSGSMGGAVEIIAKSFITACLRTIDCKVIAHNQYYHLITNIPEELAKLPMDGDECFDKLSPQEFKCDVFMVVTDINISPSESEGLYNFAQSIRATHKYLLGCSAVHFNNHLHLNRVFKRYYVRNASQFAEFAKKLVGQFI